MGGVGGEEGFCDRQGRAAVREADLDHGPCLSSGQEVTKDITVGIGKGDSVEVTLRSLTSWTLFLQLPSG